MALRAGDAFAESLSSPCPYSARVNDALFEYPKRYDVQSFRRAFRKYGLDTAGGGGRRAANCLVDEGLGALRITRPVAPGEELLAWYGTDKWLVLLVWNIRRPGLHPLAGGRPTRASAAIRMLEEAVAPLGLSAVGAWAKRYDGRAEYEGTVFAQEWDPRLAWPAPAPARGTQPRA